MGKITHAAKRAAFHKLLTVEMTKVNKDQEGSLTRLLNFAENYMKDTAVDVDWNSIRKMIADKDSTLNHYISSLLKETDPYVLETTVMNLGFEAFFNGTKKIRASREKYHCNIPWLILMDPTSACNLKCTGCWASEYGNKLNLTLEEMNSVIAQGRELGTYLYMFTGGEPLVRKNDLIKICETNNDCAFLAFTNGTLIDEAFCKEMKRVGNLYLAISLEGFGEDNDFRRGNGVYEKVINTMKLLKKHGLIFGTSICYTRTNTEAVTSDEFIKLMIESGCRYALYFHYMPVGNGAAVELLPTVEQRGYIHDRIRKIRSLTDGSGLFAFDFQNDGEFVGGCIAGGRNYFHINANGDAEPCVFIHYSGANIRENTLLEVLNQPLFMAYYHSQPFNDNMLRPCPMLENPEILQRMVEESGARSTDLQSPESAEHLCEKCKEYAAEWAPCADEIWSKTEHRKSAYENYRR